MTAHVSGTGPAGSEFHKADDAKKQSAAAAGQWKGLAVSAAANPASLIADAAEELTFAAGETVEKDVTERRKPGRERRVRQIVPPVGVKEKFRRTFAERLAKLLAAVRAAAGNPAAFRRAIQDFSPDPTERHAALLWLEETLADQPSLAELARREREALEASAGPAVQAGYNLDGVDPRPLAGPAEAGEVYRRTVLGHGGIGAVLDEVLERHGAADFAATVDFLRRAVGADLSAAQPSVDKRELEAMVNDLYHLRALGNFTGEFDADLGRLRGGGRKPPLPLAGVEVLRLLCRAKDERLVVLDGLRTSLALEGRADATYDVQALTLAQRLAQRLPTRLFADEDARQRLLAAGQKLLDGAIDLEESMAEGG